MRSIVIASSAIKNNFLDGARTDNQTGSIERGIFTPGNGPAFDGY
jgi:hypothetical protein